MRIILLLFFLTLSQHAFSQQSDLGIFNSQLERLLGSEIEELKTEFLISHVLIGTMNSINWDSSTDGFNSWNAQFWPIKDGNNLSFDLTMPIEQNLTNTGNFLEQKSEILNMVKSTFLYEHINDTIGRTLNIHFTNSKSFSRKAQQSFFKQCPNELSKSTIQNADELIFLTMTNERGYSRWLITPEQIILWHFDGKTPIGDVNIDNNLKAYEIKQMVEQRDTTAILNMFLQGNTSYPYSKFAYSGEPIE